MEKAYSPSINSRTLSVDQIGTLTQVILVYQWGGTIYACGQATLNVNAKDSDWLNRDCFILSGHGSALLYSLLHNVGLMWHYDLRTSAN